jgi:hypothetical protein
MKEKQFSGVSGDGSILLKLILKLETFGLDMFCSGHGQIAGFYRHGTEHRIP